MPLSSTSFNTALLIATLILATLAGCVSTSGVVSDKVADSIPDKAEVITVTTRQSADELYSYVLEAIGRSGFAVSESNDQARTIITAPHDIGQETRLVMQINVMDEPNARSAARSQARITGRWGVSGSMAAGFAAMGSGATGTALDPARWTYGRSKRAFAALAAWTDRAFADGAEISYSE